MTKTVEQRFSQSHSTYHDNADIQAYMASHLMHFCQPYLENAFRIVEFGIGTGLLTELLLKQKPEADFDFIDISFPMVIAAQTRLMNLSKGKRVNFVVGDILDYKLPECCDLLISNACVQWIEHFPKFIQDLNSRIPSESIFAFATFGPGNLWQLRNTYKEVLKKELPVPVHYHEMEKMHEWFSSNGFVVEISNNQHHLQHFKTFREMLQVFKDTGVNANEPDSISKSQYQDMENYFSDHYSNDDNSLELSWNLQFFVVKKL